MRACLVALQLAWCFKQLPLNFLLTISVKKFLCCIALAFWRVEHDKFVMAYLSLTSFSSN